MPSTQDSFETIGLEVYCLGLSLGLVSQVQDSFKIASSAAVNP